MIGFAIFLAAAAAAYGVARLLGLPITPVLLVAGVVLARLNLLPADILQESLVLGLTFLLFTTGVELSPRRVRSQARAALVVGVLQFVLLGVLGVAASLALGFDVLTAVYLGLALTASSTLVVVRLLQQRRQLFEPSGRLVVGVLLLQDVLVILLIPLLIRTPEGVEAVVRGLLGTLALVGLAYATLRWITPRIARLHAEEETLLIQALMVLFVFIGLSYILDIPLAAGAFLAGVALSPFPMSAVVRSQLRSVGDFFTAIFFLALGGLLTPPSWLILGQTALLASLVIVVTPVLVTVVAERAGFVARPAIESGVLLSQTSELSLVVGLQGLLLNQISQDVFTILALVTVTTMVLTPFLVTEPVVRLLLRMHPLTDRVRDAGGTSRHRGHVLLLGCGSGGMPLLETLLTMGEDVVVIDDDPEIVERLRQGDVPAIRGDASDPKVLAEADAAHAKLISSTIRRPRDHERLLGTVQGVPVLIRVFEDEDANWVRERGGTPVLYSEAAAEDFHEWFKALRASSSRNGEALGTPPAGAA